MKIGLTGGIACGKSTVAAMLAKRGAIIVDADQLAREVVLPGEAALGQVVERFGSAVLHEDGTLNRSALGAVVFSDKDKLAQLEAIVHPAIRLRMQQRLNRYEQERPDRLHIADIPLLFETGQSDLYEGILVVYIPASLQLRRLMSRDQAMTEEQAWQRIGLQMDIEEKKNRADWVIDNSGTIEATEQQVEKLLLKLGL